MKKIHYILTVLVLIPAIFINCSEDETTGPTDKSPSADISSPADGEYFIEGEMMNFAGMGTDPEDGILPEASLVWTSDKDGEIGTGSSFARDDLTMDTHLITLSVTDSKGHGNSERVTIRVISYDRELVSIPSTSGYLMGFDGIAPPTHTVSLNAYQIGKYEVTYALWLDVRSWGEANGYTFENAGVRGWGSGTTAQHPVIIVNWRDCIAWCNAYSEKEGFTPVYYTEAEKTMIYRDSATGGDIGNDCVDWDADGFRLPTEAEWEYAARYIDGSNISSGAQHSGYNLYPVIGECAWYASNSGNETHPVGQREANSLDVKDMSGNVWEWCWDWLGSYPATSQDNPRGPSSSTGRVHRGGGFSDLAEYCPTSYRESSDPRLGASICGGFRVCRNLSAP